ncbi:VWA domain-containing protein [Hyphomicrobium methylovorum]|uniref:vWA domain-containing protein n=1 Tax=Hyphomicrobium methylovorum TaxID=84 RepID=UPI0015E6AF71|nr:VWA domain-containing protein [Hyphomicrobium methylovorum]MBA2124706.1 VWA domain-containing protein [Hyphomicrobium methylovorum]
MRLDVLHFAAGLTALLFAGIAPAAHANDTTTMLIVDGSGSMWARLPPDNRAKIDIVRETLGKTLMEPSSTRVGLISFGHRRRGDCNDVELIAAPDSAREAVAAPLAKLNPRGPGPVTSALKLAAEAIGTSRPAQIVIVGDNADNCHQDTCALARDFARSTPGVAVHVVGIGIPASERPRISCVSDATGGHYYDITNSTGLSAALEEVAKIAILAPSGTNVSAPSAEAAPPPPPKGASLRVSAALIKGGALIDQQIRWRIRQAGGSDVLGETTGRDISAKLSAGSYDIEAQLGSIIAKGTITVADGGTESIVLPLDAAHLSVRAVASKGSTSPSPSAIMTVSSDGKPVAIEKGGRVDLFLRPGTYALDVADGIARDRRALKLAAGDDAPIEIALETGVVELTANTADGKVPADVLYSIYEDDPESPNGRREVARSRADAPTFTVPAGTYYVSARSGAADVRERLAVSVGETVRKTLKFDLVPLKLATSVAGAAATDAHGVVYRIDRLDGDRTRIARASGSQLAIDLPAGRYRVSSSLAAFNLSTSRDVTLAAGKPMEATLTIDGGQVNFKPPSGTYTGARDVFWEVIGADGARVWHATDAESRALLAPGHYKVRFEAQNVRLEAAFEVRSGETTEVKVGQG